MFLLTLYLTKLINLVIKSFNLGSGYTWPGHIALKINPNFLSSSRIKFNKGIIFISGTNGKTTTSKLVTHFLTANGLTYTHNKTGANLLNGIATSILLDMDLFGNLKSDVGVFEIDEFTLPLVLKHFQPTVLALLNLSRDQLDRYGEVDIIYDRWKEAIKTLPLETILVANSEQDLFKDLPSVFKGDIRYFDSKPHINVPENLHVKNINTAYQIAIALKLDLVTVQNSLSTFEVAYGRGEVIKYNDKKFQIILAKNPASFTHNLEIINSGNISTTTILFVLNDNIPDGRDVSWIYDIPAEELFKACRGKSVYISGTRYLDMAIRLQYAGVSIEKDHISESLEALLKKLALSPTEPDILVLPNYSAMLEARRILTGKAIL